MSISKRRIAIRYGEESVSGLRSFSRRSARLPGYAYGALDFQYS